RREVVTSMRHAQERESEGRVLLRAVGRLWTAGVEVEWEREGVEGGGGEGRRRRVGVPGYAFERQRYWIEAPAQAARDVRRVTAKAAEPSDAIIADAPSEIGQTLPAEMPEQAVAESTGASVALHPRPNLQNAYVAPANKLEQGIAAIWQEALGIRQVGINDNFFELGGDSLAAIHVIARLKEELKTEVPVVSLYETLTVRMLAEVCTTAADKEDEQPVKENVEEFAERENKVQRRKLYQQQRRLEKSR
ncbi:MAG: phosphopantetheine-binding protein, partial [Acidobacteria bacterium]|nr:phosphopantetheine-binding protein [Acidobacteriota bacterium]